MVFTSAVFPLFFGVVYALYLLTRRSYRTQNVIILVASYIFYGYWDIRFLLLLWFTTAVDYTVGRALGVVTDERRRRLILAVSLACNLGVLGFFKYFNFFTENTVEVLNALNFDVSPIELRILLPVGISFYTFQSMSYTIDVYRRTIEPARQPLDFALFVAYFPQLVAGPISRGGHLLPQLGRKRELRADQINAGIFLIVWGFYKKIVIADNVAIIANRVFDNYTTFSGLDVVIGTVAFAFQIYCDFSAYTDIARGLAKLMGIDLVLNFRLPYIALGPGDFWRRWHISLSQWLRDYVYIPLGGNRRGARRTSINLMITMLLGGLWHGAAWTFVIWGGYHGLLMVLEHRFDTHGRTDRATDRRDLWTRVVPRATVMFALVCVGWVFFRAASVTQAFHMLGSAGLSWSDDTWSLLSDLLFFIVPLLVVQWFQARTRNLLVVTRLSPVALGMAYGIVLVLLVVYGVREQTEFIYFQF